MSIAMSLPSYPVVHRTVTPTSRPVSTPSYNPGEKSLIFSMNSARTPFCRDLKGVRCVAKHPLNSPVMRLWAQ